MDTKGEHYFVEVRYRPRQVAFLVDVGESPDAIFNEIVDFNICSWGGRFNPIIPVRGGEVCESYWALLELANPDLLYSYCDLSPGTVRRIASHVRPLDVRRHNAAPLPANMKFRVGIDEQATVFSTLRHETSPRPGMPWHPEPAVLVFDPKDDWQLSPFVIRNFGSSDRIAKWCGNHQIRCKSVAPDDLKVFSELSTNRGLITGILACTIAPRKRRADSHQAMASLALCYGDSAWDFVEYWNLALFRGEPANAWTPPRQIWLTPNHLANEEFYKALVEFIGRRISGEHSTLCMVSHDQPKEKMQEITQQICKDLRFQIRAAEPAVRQKGELGCFQTAGVVSFYPPLARPQSRQVSGKKALVELEPLAQEGEQLEVCMAELVIENSGQERYIANSTPWWKLPRKEGLARLFVPDLRSRVGNDNLICAEVSTRQDALLITIPDDAALFDRLLLPPSAPDWARRLDCSLHEDFGAKHYIGLSDKGMYTRGVLGLFKSLQEAAYVFEHPFWRGVVESMSVSTASDKVRNKVREDLANLSAADLSDEMKIQAIVDEVVDAATHIQKPEHYVKFGRLFDRYWKYLQTLPTDEQVLEIGELTAAQSSDLGDDEGKLRNLARENLRNMLSEMAVRKLFLIGVELECGHCLASLWYHVDDLHSVVTCRGCRREIDLPAEKLWSYALNELVASAARDHGVIPVIRTVWKIFEKSRSCFRFAAGVNITEYETRTQVCELDLVWILDGEFGVAEVKRNSKKFQFGKNLSTVLNTVSPGRVALVANAGTSREMEESRSEISSKIGSGVTVEAWDPAVFDHAAHIGWRSFRYGVGF